MPPVITVQANGAEIRRRRTQMGLTQLQLAKKVGYSRPAIAKLERSRDASLALMQAVAGALGCGVIDIAAEGIAVPADPGPSDYFLRGETKVRAPAA